jgi:hypothetical protein
VSEADAGFLPFQKDVVSGRRGTEVVVTGSTRNRLVPLKAGHVGSNPTLSAMKFAQRKSHNELGSY